jgi:hypothetical protein
MLVRPARLDGRQVNYFPFLRGRYPTDGKAPRGPLVGLVFALCLELKSREEKKPTAAEFDTRRWLHRSS